MTNTRKEIMNHVSTMNSLHELDQENTILVSQVQNMAKQRIAESCIILVPLAVSRRLLAPRLGFIKPSFVQGILIDLVIPLSYYYYQSHEDQEKYARMLGIDAKEQMDMETRERRTRFIDQFWSNSQYWH